jgi:A-factor biosynthesis hotdog domain
MMFYAKNTYTKLRSYQRKDKQLGDAQPHTIPPRVDPDRVGRVFDRNVTIGESAIAGSAGEHRYVGIVDQKHPCFFDHPGDHVPGALLIEIYRQAAIATATGGGEATPAAAVVTHFDVQLSDFAELEAPVECSATITDEPADGGVAITIAMHQFDSQIGDAHVELSFV